MTVHSALRVVYTKSGTRLSAAIINQPGVVIDHKLYWLPVRSMSEARYLVAILNAPITTELVSEYQSFGLFGGRDFDTYPWRLAIPTYEVGNPVHEELVALSAECEGVAADVPTGGKGFQKVRAAIRQQLDAQGLSERLDKAVSELLELGKSE